jgi:hypothetical protein
MSSTEILTIGPRLALLLAGLLLPGSVLLRAGRLPWSLAGSFTASYAVLYVSVLGCTLVHAPISLATLVLCLAAYSAFGVFVAFSRGGRCAPDEAPAWAFLTTLRGWTPVYVAFLAVVAYRLGTDPLSGPDVHFRWSYLAEQMLRFGSLDFYPPHTGGNFVRYFWAESIPPGIAGAYGWAYACGGSYHPLWTVPVVALQLLSLHDLVWRLGFRHGGVNAARLAVLLAAASPLLTWSFLIGQETGLVAVAVCGMVWCLDRPVPDAGCAVLAGVCAIVASSTREYGLAYAVAAVATTAWFRATRRYSLIVAAVALPVTAIWPLRTWALTGNPFFSLNLAGLFPTNAVFVLWNDAFRSAQQSALGSAAGWGELARYLILWALPSCLGLLALLVLLFRRAAGAVILAGFAALAVILWLASVAYTAGGLFYSLRVLTPALALLAVAAARFGETIARSAIARGALATALGLISLEALPKTLVLPDNPYRVPLRDWPTAGLRITESFHSAEPELAAKLTRLPGPRRIASDGFDLPNLGATIGLEVAPLWSPDFDWLFDQSMDPAVAAQRWRASGLRFIVIGRTGPMKDWLQTHAQMHTRFYNIEQVDETSSHVFLEIKPSGVTARPD